MKVLVVSHMYPHALNPTYGIFVQEEVRELAKRCQVKVVSPTPWFFPLKIFKKWYAYTRIPLAETRSGIEVLYPRTIAFPKKIAFSLSGFTFFLSLLRCARVAEKGFRFDLIHAHTVYPDGFAAVLAARALRRPVVITLHGSDVNVHFQHRIWRKLGLFALSRADQVIAVGEGLRRTVANKQVTNEDKITVIPNGVDVSRFVPLPRVEALKRLGLQSEGSKILYVGNMRQSKGIDYLLKAAKMLLETFDHHIEFFLIGEGEYERQARLLAGKLGITHAVHFTGGKPNEEIPLWMNAGDVLVLPSLSEGFGVVLIEAMACGRPVVATRCGGPEDIVTPDTGILVPPADEDALWRAMAEVLRSRHQFTRQKIREYVVHKYAYERIAALILEVYRQALDR